MNLAGKPGMLATDPVSDEFTAPVADRGSGEWYCTPTVHIVLDARLRFLSGAVSV